MSWIVSLLFFYKDDFGINITPKVDMPLNKKWARDFEEEYQSNVDHIYKFWEFQFE